MQGWKTGFPDMVGKCENRIDAGDVLVEECSWTSTNTGNLVAPDGSTIPPTGESVNLKNVLIWEFEDGKVKSVKNSLGHDDNAVSIGISRLSGDNFT